jgi:hypothetical protein
VDIFIEYCCRYGWPESVRTDKGTQFVSNLWRELCQRMNIKHRKIVVYRPQGKPTERQNRTIKQSIKAYISSHRDWDKHLSEISFAMRSAPSYTTVYTPAALKFGRELRHPTDLSETSNEAGETTHVTNCTPAEYVGALQQRLSEALAIARE